MFAKKNIILALFVTLVWTAGAYAEIKEGLWEVTTQSEIKGAPVQMPATVVKQCITKEKPAPRPASGDYECKTLKRVVNGDTVTYTIECWGPGGLMTTKGTTTYKGTTFNGKAATKMKSKGQPEVHMSNKISGKYIGPCKK